MDISHIGQTIQAKRKEIGLTQKELAAKIGVSDKAVSRWERGAGSPDISLLPSIARELGISVDALMGVTEYAEAEQESRPKKPNEDSKVAQKRVLWPYLLSICGTLLLASALIGMYVQQQRDEQALQRATEKATSTTETPAETQEESKQAFEDKLRRDQFDWRMDQPKAAMTENVDWGVQINGAEPFPAELELYYQAKRLGFETNMVSGIEYLKLNADGTAFVIYARGAYIDTGKAGIVKGVVTPSFSSESDQPYDYIVTDITIEEVNDQ